MAKRKLGGLGKGLDSLFEDLPMTEDASPDLTRLPVREIEPDPDQPRKNFDEDAMAALAESIGENGLLQPIAVRAKKTGPGYVIIAGERRWRAARMAGLDEVPVLIKEVTDEQAAALALIENLQREDLDPIEVAEGCKKLIERYGLTQEEAAGQKPQRHYQRHAPAEPAGVCAGSGADRGHQCGPCQSAVKP